MEGVIYTIIITILVLSALMIPMILISRRQDRYGKSEFDDIIFLKDKIILFSNIYHSGGDGDGYRNCRISEINRSNGVISRRLVSIKYGKFKIVGEINNKIWLKDDSFCVFDPETFKIIFAQDQIGDKLPELNNVKIRDLYLNEIDKKVYFLAENANKYCINPDTFEIKRENFSQKDYVIKKVEKTSNITSFWFNKDKESEKYQLFYNSQRICAEQMFINPDFLRKKTSNQIIWQNNPESIVIIHYDSLNSTAQFSLSLISNSGQVMWNITQQQLQIKPQNEYNNAAIEHIDYQEHILTIVFKAKRDKIVCIDIAKGLVLWNLKM